jgi:hypothetical protein
VTVLQNAENKKGMLCPLTTIGGKHYVNILDNDDPISNLIKIPMEEMVAYF